MKFENDIFISYTHADNGTAFTEQEEGWIDAFHKALEYRLHTLLGRKPKIWRDPKLEGNDEFAQTLVEQLPRVVSLISILSPRYLNSEWCLRELNEFWAAAEHSGGARIDNKSRVFKVLKLPVEVGQHPTEIQGQLGYAFYDPETEAEIDPYFKENQREFFAKLHDLGRDIVKMLKRCETLEPAAAGDGDKPVVYLAQTTADVRSQYDEIRRDLSDQGFVVLPDQDLRVLGEELDDTIREALSRARVSIHLVGSTAGFTPEGTDDSILEIQTRLAAERADSGEFSRLVWIPPTLSIDNERHRDWVAELRADPGLARGGDFLERPLGDLKTEVNRLLRESMKPKPPPPRAAAVADGASTVYLICNEQDDVSAVEEALFARGLEVLTPLFEGEADPEQLSADHQNNLATCDAVLIYYGAGTEPWARAKRSDLRGIAGTGRTEPLRAAAILKATPPTPRKDRLKQSHEAMILDATSGFSPDQLEPFLAELGTGDEGDS